MASVGRLNSFQFSGGILRIQSEFRDVGFLKAVRLCACNNPAASDPKPTAMNSFDAVHWASLYVNGLDGRCSVEWTIQELGSVGEFVGAIGVVVTLGYLAFQIRQNTFQLKQNALTTKAAAVNASNIALRETRQSIFTSAEMSDFFLQGNENPGELGEVQMLRYRLVMQNVTEVMLDIYTQTAVTNFSPETWATQGTTLVKRVLGTSGGKWFWAMYADNYPPAFRGEVDRILRNLSSSGQ